MFKVERQENGTHDIYIPHNDMIEKQCRTRVVTEEVETVQKLVMIDDYNLHMSISLISWCYTMDIVIDLESGEREYSFIYLTKVL